MSNPIQGEEVRRAPASQKTRSTRPSANPSAIGGTVSITINGQEIKVPLGTTILEAARNVGIRIPTLCHHPDLCVAGVCRICRVEVEGQRTLQAACAYPVTTPIKVHTHTQKVRQARRHILDLLLSEHYGECYACGRNSNCELQALAKEYGVDFFRFGHPRPAQVTDRPLQLLGGARQRQVRAVPALRAHLHRPAGGGHHRGAGPQPPQPDPDLPGQAPGQRGLHQLRPVHQPLPHRGPARQRPHRRGVGGHPGSDKHVVIQTAPSPRAAIGECFGLPPGQALTFELNTALRMCGFDRVFDTNFTADLTILEEGTELLLRLKTALVDGKPPPCPSSPAAPRAG